MSRTVSHPDDTTRFVPDASGREEVNMSKDRVTGKKAASAAGKTLSSGKASKAAKSAAASALSQRPSGRK